MPSFGKASKDRLATCHPDLQKIMNELVKFMDVTILEGRRTLEQQKAYVAKGVSKTLNSKHIPDPSDPNQYSHAVDVAPYPVDWSNDPKNLARFYFMAGAVFKIANDLGINIRWGGSWDGTMNFKSNKFNDLPHFELKS